MGLKRQLAKTVEKLAGVLIVRPSEAFQLPELTHLRRFFDHFGVDCVFDVGANEGQYATFIREIVGFRGRIISFEPIPELADGIKRLAAGDPLWSVENLALDIEAGPATFNIMAESVFSSLLPVDENQPEFFSVQNRPARQIEVMRDTLEASFARLQAQYGFERPFLKMDTQGNDLSIVKGGPKAMQQFVGLQSELSMRSLYVGSPGYIETLSVYQELGFKLSAMVANTPGHFPDLIEMDCIMYRPGAKEFGERYKGPVE